MTRDVREVRAEGVSTLLFVLVGGGLLIAGLVNLIVSVWREL